jgi:bifunctional non-homologous end joining protein LigD
MNMSKAFDFCIPTRGTKVPHTRIGSRNQVRRLSVAPGPRRQSRTAVRPERQRLDEALSMDRGSRPKRQKRFVLDGEAVVIGVDGTSDFNALHSGTHNEEVQLYAFDMLAGDGDDMQQLPLSMRKANLARLLARRTEGI